MEIKKAIDKGFSFLERKHQNGFYSCQVSERRDMNSLRYSPNEVASSVLILNTALSKRPNAETTKKVIKYVLNNLEEDKTISFFEDKKLLPSDTETTSFTLSTLIKTNTLNIQETKSVAEKISKNIDKNKLIQIYFNPEEYNKKNRVDHVALSNICYFLYQNGLNHQVKESIEYLTKHFEHDKFQEGSRYYFSPESAIYFSSKLIEFPELKNLLERPLKEALRSRIGKTNYPLDLAMRIVSANKLEINNFSELNQLISLQNKDGSFPINSIYKFGSKEGYFGSREISTAFALEALMSMSLSQ